MRQARRRAGLSQRAMAMRSGIGSTTLADLEAGRHQPSLPVLEAVLAAAGLVLAVDTPVQPPCRHLRRHLRDSLSVRLHRWLGGSGDPRRERALPLWCQLRALAATGRVELPGRAALGLWLPDPVLPSPLEVGFLAHPGAQEPGVPDLRLRALSEGRGVPVRVSIGMRSIETPTPGALALDPRCAAERRALRGVAAILFEQGPRDRAGRRTAAHRDPEHEREEYEVWHTKRWKLLDMPPAHDRRSWRLEDEASLAAWLRTHGFPT